jgi:hypothetical protein
MIEIYERILDEPNRSQVSLTPEAVKQDVQPEPNFPKTEVNDNGSKEMECETC